MGTGMFMWVLECQLIEIIVKSHSLVSINFYFPFFEKLLEL